MALTTTDARSPLGTSIVYQSDATTAGDDGLFGAGASTLYQVSIDNSANSSGAPCYVKLYNGTAAYGNDPVMVLLCNGAAKKTYTFVEGIAFSGALGLRCVTAPATSSVADPASDVKVYLVGG